MSSYLFVLALEALSRLLYHRIAQTQDFVYHWRCSKTKLSHMCFADDIMLFCGKSLSSATVLNGALTDFSKWSGLRPNHTKSHIFIAGSDLDFNEEFQRVFNFQLGILPVKYLGLPLITTKLSAADCKLLIDVARIRGWTVRPLSYAGRLQLLQSVCSSIHVFWTSHLLLSKKVINKVEQLMCEFLWKGHVQRRGGSKVAWKTVTSLLKEGGLGLK